MVKLHVKISPASVNDVVDIQELLRTTWLSTYPNKEHGITKKHIQQLVKSITSQEVIQKKQMLVADMPSHVHLSVAKQGEGVVGICAGSKMENRAHLKSLYIHPDMQGKGVGTLLWNEFKSWSAGSQEVYLHVATYNYKAINFYQKMGFVDTGKRFIEDRYTFLDGKSIPQVEMKYYF
tara:strand:- start:419 stop:952 length:534 start_codon:yes stop_codon:yes gene_type:complete